jgi:hypothetical protein
MVDARPSETVTVMVAMPTWVADGVRPRVRESPVPPMVMAFWGTSVGLEQVADTWRLAAPDSASPTAKPMPDMAAPAAVVWLVMSVMSGGELALGPPATVVFTFALTKFTSVMLREPSGEASVR